jgi:hypothetical protein
MKNFLFKLYINIVHVFLCSAVYKMFQGLVFRKKFYKEKGADSNTSKYVIQMACNSCTNLRLLYNLMI